jgi:antitoxin (DNA-binding transcriptional repressor) of toxin-antitoxin stability system
MQTINIHEAKTHLSRLVDQAASGEVEKLFNGDL